MSEETNKGLTDEEESSLLAALQQAQFSMNHVLDMMEHNQSLLEDSVRSVRTAAGIVAESNRMARVRMQAEEILAGVSKTLVSSVK